MNLPDIMKGNAMTREALSRIDEISIEPGIVLRRLSESDGKLVFDLVEKSRAYLSRFDAFIAEVISREQITDQLKYATLPMGLLVNGELAGMFSVNKIDWNQRTGNIGYWLGAGFAGRGLASKALGAMIHFCFHELKIERLEATTATTNRASIRLLERVGFELEKVITAACVIRGQPVDDGLYVLKKPGTE